MARVTIEDSLENVENRYALVHAAAKRARQLFRGADPLVRCKNNEVVTSLREIAEGHVRLVLDQDSMVSTPAAVSQDSNLTQ